MTFLRERHHHADVGRVDRLQAPGRTFAGSGGRGIAEPGEKHVAERAVHRLRHELRQERACRTDHGAGDDHRGIVEYESLEGDREARQCVVQGDDDRHVGAADGQRHADAEHERQHEDAGDRPPVRC